LVLHGTKPPDDVVEVDVEADGVADTVPFADSADVVVGDVPVNGNKGTDTGTDGIVVSNVGLCVSMVGNVPFTVIDWVVFNVPELFGDVGTVVV
jgi:hypothetical protein